MNEHMPLIERLEALVDRNNRPDWEDVVRRAEEAPAEGERPERTRSSRRSYLARRLVPAFALAAAIIAVGLIAPWQHGPGSTVMGRALAAIEDKPVLHAVFRDQTKPTDLRYVDLATSQETPITTTTEIWYDKGRDFEHLKRGFEAEGVFAPEIVTDLLITPAETFTPYGPDAPGQQPSLPVWLTGFFDTYSSALENGTAHVAGTGTVNGHDVTWIELELEPGACSAGMTCTERVAIDRVSSLPLQVQWHANGAEGVIDITSIETLPAGSGDFSKPEKMKTTTLRGLSLCLLYEANLESNLSPGSKFQVTPTDRAGAVEALPSALWPGPTLSSLPLSGVTSATGSSQDWSAKSTPIVQTGIELVYGKGPVAALWGHESVQEDEPGGTGVVIHEQEADPDLVFWPVSPAPPAGSLLIETQNGETTGWLEKNGNYVYLRATSLDLLLAAARTLEPIPKP